ncbi:ABC transporter permease [Phaeodactylibacter luteus]|uniref:ABC transporter permease n=1 Tax=Phaeodactylibacter luteus TaxID=1564516 RepID=A0A5C6RH26_9BACT|nr:ABC transporter permease [Phaeodactylibacter luteus]TXB61611.1 ABC transporter permease [Phaeodactylibacter luteus]
MLQYLIKRILIFLPTLLVISLLAFGLSKAAPGDPVEQRNRGLGDEAQRSLANADRVYRETAAYLGLDKPVFYFSIAPAAYPDTLYRILKRDERETLEKLTAQYGNWPLISSYYHQLRALDRNSETTVPDDVARRKVRPLIKQLYLGYKDSRITSLLDQLASITGTDTAQLARLHPDVVQLQQHYQAVKAGAKPERLYLPDLKWYGFDNQYHNWLSSFLLLDFGKSYIDSRPVADKMKDALRWTLIMNILAISLAYLLSIPLGVYSAVYKGSLFDRTSTLLLFILYSLPNFWIATMLVVFFTTPEYGMDWFPSLGLGDLPPGAPFWERFVEAAEHLILPIFCLTYGALAFISRQVRGGMLNVIRQDFVRTAWAKGLNARQVIWKHTFRNALFPIITMFASLFPAVFAGSLVIEVIFNIPGMGKLTVDAIFQRDWPVVYTVLMLAALLTMAGMLIADVLYAWVDPRVNYQKKKA